ncbi:MAG: methylenetetrahydrofolate reductase [NAD(P)H] [Burkholderiaceae bacterium]|jgi:methylenetetrahydrofolate reductase (NADPH)|nr:methylenetetrahydrofolate reductase [NAD(P)H] [Burkholderiaceae bacterium]
MQRSFSFEFFPPKTPEGADKLRAVRDQLAALRPEFFSVTFGAGGSTREGTWNTVTEIAAAGLSVAPHISCIGTTRADVAGLLDAYRARGIRRLVALRGDLPSGAGTAGGDFRHANELVAFIREHTGDWFHIEVAAYPEFHPQARSAEDDLRNFVRKVQAGADSAITQYFYNSDAYFRFVDDASTLGVTVPIVPGIMPITNFSQLARFSDACGAEIPRWIRARLQAYGDDKASIRAFGLDVVTDLCEQLLSVGVPGLHFYTMNQAEPTIELWQRLSLPR